MRDKLRLRPDGTYKIVQFTDVHWKNGDEADLRSESLMERILAEENPDLVFYTGDLVRGEFCADPAASLLRAVRAAESASIPWAFVFGNHDAEAAATRGELMAAARESAFCLAEEGPYAIHGVGNYVLDIMDSEGDRIAASLYAFDSGGNAPPSTGFGGYDWIRRSQIEWYVWEASQRVGLNGEPIPSLAFFHIPLPEYNDIWDFHTCCGSKFEPVGCAKINSGLFAAFAEMKDVIGTFAGHDHVNDYWGELHGIRLCYGRATGYNTYGREGFPRGARIISLNPGRRAFDSWIRLDDGTVVTRQEPHLPECLHREPYVEVSL